MRRQELRFREHIVTYLAVPASWEPDIGHDALRARTGRHGSGLASPSEHIVKASEGQLAVLAGLLSGTIHRVADYHAETRGEGLDIVDRARREAGRVVDGHTAATGTVKADVGPLRDPDVAAITSTEKQSGRPVVGEVF